MKSREAYVNGINLCGFLFRWLDLIAIHNPERDFWKTNQNVTEENDEKVSRADAPPSNIWGKLKWFGSLWINVRCVYPSYDLSQILTDIRGIRWNIESRSLPATVSKDYPTGQWLVRKSIRTGIMAIGYYLDSKVLKFYTKDVPYSDFFAQSILWQVFVSWMYAYRTYFQLEAMYNICAVISVLIGIYDLGDWPPVMGSFRRDAYTIRKMWGTCWHQLMRRQCGEAGRIVVNLFGFRKGSFMSKYSQVWIGFLVSTFAHHIGGVHGGYGKEECYNQFLYFMIQPAGIMFEDFVIFWAKKLGLKESGKTCSSQIVCNNILMLSFSLDQRDRLLVGYHVVLDYYEIHGESKLYDLDIKLDKSLIIFKSHNLKLKISTKLLLSQRLFYCPSILRPHSFLA